MKAHSFEDPYHSRFDDYFSPRSEEDLEINRKDSAPPVQPVDYKLISDADFEKKVTLAEHHSPTISKNHFPTVKDVDHESFDVFPHDESFHEQLLKYNNNKLFLPNICTVHKGEGFKFKKLPGELIMTEVKIYLTVVSTDDSLPVHAIVTNFRLLFLPNDPHYLMQHHLRSDYFSIPLTLINTFRKAGEKKNHFSPHLKISTKCGRKFRLAFSYETGPDALRLIEVLDNHIPPRKIQNHFAFNFHSSFKEFESKYKGWSVYDLRKEFYRQGVCLLPFNAPKEDVINAKSSPDLALFKIFPNSSYSQSGWLCDTYPAEFIVPALVDLEELKKCAKFRSKRRLPVLTFCYKNEGRMATLWRSSQCNPGFSRHRSHDDENYLKLMGGSNNADSKEGTINLHIYDARPFLNAMANKMNGKGYENISHYKNASIVFLDIDNIHGVRDRYKKLVELSASLNTEKLTSSLDYSGWVDSLAYILAGAKMIVEKSIKQGINALIHCSDGWDRTTQLNSLVQLMLDPYFRTIEGFEVLIEKDWVCFGHMFKSRGGWKPTGAFDEDRRSPVFVQFLDCVHQLQNQFPAEFEFNLRFLTDIGYYSRTGLFGTFLSDNYEEMMKNGVPENTTSIWSFINANKDMYKSSLHQALSEHSTFFKREIFPDTNLINMRFWREYFCFYSRSALEENKGNVEVDSKNDLYEIALSLQMKKISMLKNETDIMFEKVKELTAELAKYKGNAGSLLLQNSEKECLLEKSKE